VNLLLLYESDREGDTRFVVRGPRARHIRDVLGLERGKTLRVGLLDAEMGTGTIVDWSEDWVRLDASFDEPTPRPLTDLLLAVPRSKTLRKLLPEVSAMGIDRCVLMRTWRVDKQYLSARILEPDRYRPLLHDGLMQGKFTHAPRLSIEPLFKPFVEDRLGAMLEPGSLGLIAHPTAERRLADLEIGAEQRVVLAVGPEGGFIPYEVDALCERGLMPVSMGPRTLRVETACVALLAQIDLLRQQG